jgi:hypothetical protein
VARALTLAGYLNDTKLAARLWDTHINLLELSPWLSSVREKARRNYERNVRAKYWFGQFLRTRGDDQAYAGYRLFETCLDRRHAIWGQPMIDDCKRKKRLSIGRLRHIDATIESRRERLRKISDDEKKTLYHQQIIHYMAPWY